MKVSFALVQTLVVWTLINHVSAASGKAKGIRGAAGKRHKGFEEIFGIMGIKVGGKMGGVMGRMNTGRKDGFPLTSFRSYDGSDRDDNLGEAHSPLTRLTSKTSYMDDKEEMDINGSISPRTISNIVSAQDGSIPNKRGLSDMIWQWGQFLDHDIGLSDTSDAFGVAAMAVPEDPTDIFSQNNCTVMEFSRSEYILDTDGQRMPVNLLTSYIDASQVYGSDDALADALRHHKGGLMNTTANGRLLPLNDGPVAFPNAGGDSPELFLGGDMRANEQLGLLAFHTLFVREHNLLCTRIKRRWKNKDDEEIYQLARKIVGAEMQIITYREFLPALLGPMAPSLESYNGYDPSYDPTLSVEFTTAAFRWGHSMVSDNIGGIPLSEAFFDAEFFKSSPLNVDLLLGMLLDQQAQELDAHIVEDLRSFLFMNPEEGNGCLDLASLNMHRAKDHGMLGLNDVREAIGLAAYTTFSQLTSDPMIQTKLSAAYDNDIDKVDAWIGGLSEDHVPGASVGETLGFIMKDQFENLMHGDPYFWLGDDDLKSPALRGLIDLDTFSLSDVIDRNTKHSIIDFHKADNPFFVAKRGPDISI